MALDESCEESELIQAGQVRPGITVSFTGLDRDAAVVADTQLSMSPLGVKIILDSGDAKHFDIEELLYRFPD